MKKGLVFSSELFLSSPPPSLLLIFGLSFLSLPSWSSPMSAFYKSPQLTDILKASLFAHCYSVTVQDFSFGLWLALRNKMRRKTSRVDSCL